MLSDPAFLGIVVATFLLAGLVKGVVGMGLPTVALGVLAVTMDLSVAMALMIAPSLVTNVMQAVTGRHLWHILRGHWAFLVAALVCIWVGTRVLTSVDLRLLSGVLGLSMVVYGAVGLSGLRFDIPSARRTGIGAGLGAVNGLITGMTGSFIVPSVMYLQASGLGRDALIQAMGIVFLLSTIVLAVALRQTAILTDQLGIASLAAIIPAVLGMILGQRIRSRLSETAFRRIFLASVAVLGVYLTLRALWIAIA